MVTGKGAAGGGWQDKVLEDARKEAARRLQGYRDQALKLLPHVCAGCGREFEGKRLRELTVHHKDHNYKNNPPDGSNWELLCLYCHDNEHEKVLLTHYYGGARAEDTQTAPSIFSPFDALDKLLVDQPAAADGGEGKAGDAEAAGPVAPPAVAPAAAPVAEQRAAAGAAEAADDDAGAEVDQGPDGDHNLGPQPLAQLLEAHGLDAHGLVAASTEQITHKMVARACRGRRLTPHVQAKLCRALNRATGKGYAVRDLFTY